MKIISWNVNGLSACSKKGFFRQIGHMNADLICVQETKGRCELDAPGYIPFWNTGKRKGYSGTMVLCRQDIPPLSVRNGFGVEKFDNEGRCMTLEYDTFYVVNVYVPNSQESDARLEYRIEWDIVFSNYIQSLKKPVVICGDFNVAMDYLDIYEQNLRNVENPSGFLPIEKEGMFNLQSQGLIDVFRKLHPKLRSYTWWSNRLNKRSQNRGWRLDYFLVSESLLGGVRYVRHLQNIFGSDHCPIVIVFRVPESMVNIPYERLAGRWQSIEWEEAEEKLAKMQGKIASAAYTRDMEKVEGLQKRLVCSIYARVLAVREVSKSATAAGIDGEKGTDETDAECMAIAYSLTSRGYHITPYRQIDMMTEHDKIRTIKVPVLYDKAMQKLHGYSLLPVAEALADKKSFSARKGRSTFDAHACIVRDLAGPDPPEYVVRADVAAFYVSILHDWLMANIPMNQQVLSAFLWGGVVTAGNLFPEESIGISQGASLSAVIGNMTLDGVQNFVYNRLSKAYHRKRSDDYIDGGIVRFADDMVIYARTKESADIILEALTDFLAKRGLRLNTEKTYIAKLSEGFEFLSRVYQWKDYYLDTYPSPRAMAEREQKLKKIIDTHHGSQRTLIETLNKSNVAFADYHRVEDAREEFERIDNVVNTLLLEKLRKLHPTWSTGHIIRKYWKPTRNGRHIFALPNKPSIQLFRLADVIFVEHKPIKLRFNPYLPEDREYYAWLQEVRENQKVRGPERQAIMRRQEGRCYFCEHPMLLDQEITLVETQTTGPAVKRFSYCHRLCLLQPKGESDEPVDVISILNQVEETKSFSSYIYDDLKEFFRLCEESVLTLSFERIEEIIGDELPPEAYEDEAYWTDDPLLEDDEEPAIAHAWTSQGFALWRVDFEGKKAVFHRVKKDIAGISIPEELKENKIPIKAAEEWNDFCAYFLEKYGFRKKKKR